MISLVRTAEEERLELLRAPWARVARTAGRYLSRRWYRANRELRALARELLAGEDLREEALVLVALSAEQSRTGVR